MSLMNREKKIYDVIILGSGLGGATLGTILARHGFSVLMLEAGKHPRFAVGESIVPDFGARAKLMALCFDIPELAWMGSFQMLRHKIGASSGIKRNFTFLHHREGEPHRAGDSSQFQTMSYPLGPDSHAWRPDLDQWLTNLAIGYGADYREMSKVEGVEFDADGVSVMVAGGEKHRGRFVADATGYRSVLSEKFGLRRVPPPMHTDSRSIFTHFVGVKPIERAREGMARLPLPCSPDQGTCHHYFDGGWYWIIPFNNHREAVNPVASVGVTLDRRKYPDNDLPAAEEFHRITSRFPTVARVLDKARPVRGWVKTGRIQYGCDRLAGERWCLMPHAAGFIDALFSSGMTMTLIGAHQVARVLMKALPANDFAVARFEQMEAGTKENLAFVDRIVHGAYIAFRSHELFNAWYRFWAVCSYHGSLSSVRIHMKFLSTGRREYLDFADEASTQKMLGSGLPCVRTLIDSGYAVLVRLDEGKIDERAAIDELFSLLAAATWVPPDFHLARRGTHSLASFTVPSISRMIFWGKRHAPDDLKELCYDIGPVFYSELMKCFGYEAARGIDSFARVIWGAHSNHGRI